MYQITTQKIEYTQTTHKKKKITKDAMFGQHGKEI